MGAVAGDVAGEPGQQRQALFLVNRGEILQAPARLGHSDPATTLRIYAHALPLSDANVADAINRQLDQLPNDTTHDPIDRSPESN